MNFLSNRARLICCGVTEGKRCHDCPAVNGEKLEGYTAKRCEISMGINVVAFLCISLGINAVVGYDWCIGTV